AAQYPASHHSAVLHCRRVCDDKLHLRYNHHAGDGHVGMDSRGERLSNWAAHTGHGAGRAVRAKLHDVDGRSRWVAARVLRKADRRDAWSAHASPLGLHADPKYPGAASGGEHVKQRARPAGVLVLNILRRTRMSNPVLWSVDERGLARVVLNRPE